ncbi:formyltetrahydrofolate deformylase [Cenarchaeum symbiosum A]|uniref:Formyltetrahydrofolate deformylase n=1 Tax=Cenarchaeum symbiosum (strain A) TaxID=414004 RepID=A0RZA6_CENSY|nr:formyltetrahydrofolate deformylase [Cenarchaeum symbiosum A]
MTGTNVGITVVGEDRAGVVTAFTGFVFGHGGNIEKINQDVKNGLFGMYLEASFPGTINMDAFGTEIQEIAREYKMEVSTRHEAGPNRNVAVFVTRESHCLKAILDARDELRGRIAVVVGTEGTLSKMAEDAGVPFVEVAEKNQEEAEQRLISTCKKYDIDLIVLARYMRILNPNFVWRYPDRIMNIHPSLLPAFTGASAYAQAFERGTKIVGVTAHYVTENLDQGPIIFQDSFKVGPADGIEEIKKKGQELEARTLLKAVRMHLEGKLEVRWRRVHVKEQ